MLALTLTLLSTTVAYANDDTMPTQPGPWHFASIKCVDTTIASVTPRLEGTTMSDSGVEVWFATDLGMENFTGKNAWGVGVVHYQGDPEDAVMSKEHKGDKVQVCLVSVPNAENSPGCDPKTDPRGRLYRVYDYRLKASYAGINGEHGCGGA